ncbi:acetolactate synthase 2 small subunit [Motilimonas cestriensis]|uniref:Acetolactate synthase 2 small subunit n=1 Tax=Motilimonas cestriensis TaxID=2742685 RepID=A0ABS8W7N1_9GAMM|nr:acetolactate synthase 2 small subunit [Motilimonas cestriensis]MCE2594117.1 acetolactate synthase 2 small subunit [Motilimonas cestriensis]
MLHHLTVTAQHSPELLERVLRVMRHRGFSVQNMQMNLDSDNQQVELHVAVASERAIALLTAQLTKLIGVTAVSLTDRTAEPKLAVV